MEPVLNVWLPKLFAEFHWWSPNAIDCSQWIHRHAGPREEKKNTEIRMQINIARLSGYFFVAWFVSLFVSCCWFVYLLHSIACNLTHEKTISIIYLLKQPQPIKRIQIHAFHVSHCFTYRCSRFHTFFFFACSFACLFVFVCVFGKII